MKKAVPIIAGALVIVAASAAIGGYQLYLKEAQEQALREEEEKYAYKRQNPEELKPGEIPVKFEILQEENPDIYAWITIPGTLIDEPLLQREDDNGYYASHDRYGKESSSGALYTENYNGRDFTDPLTVVYGPNCEDETLFGSLYHYSDNLFMEEHPNIYIYTPEKIQKYRIFAAYRGDNRHLMHRYKMGEKESSRRALLNDIFDSRDMGSRIDRNAPVDETDQILTLSTHDSSGEEYRYLVQAYLEEVTE